MVKAKMKMAEETRKTYILPRSSPPWSSPGAAFGTCDSVITLMCPWYGLSTPRGYAARSSVSIHPGSRTRRSLQRESDRWRMPGILNHTGRVVRQTRVTRSPLPPCATIEHRWGRSGWGR